MSSLEVIEIKYVSTSRGKEFTSYNIGSDGSVIFSAASVGEQNKKYAFMMSCADEMYEELSNLLHESMHCEDYDRIEKLLAKARGGS